MANPGGKAQNALGLARERLRAAGTAWTLEELDQLLADQGEAFTPRARLVRPAGRRPLPAGVVPLDRLRTLRGVAETIERHHTRDFYGTDPFVGRQGLVRIVPEATGLESEGAGYYWVGGFQGGDVTTFRFSMGTIEAGTACSSHLRRRLFPDALWPSRAGWTGAART